jgi:hypothetical protein
VAGGVRQLEKLATDDEVALEGLDSMQALNLPLVRPPPRCEVFAHWRGTCVAVSPLNIELWKPPRESLAQRRFFSSLTRHRSFHESVAATRRRARPLAR